MSHTTRVSEDHGNYEYVVKSRDATVNTFRRPLDSKLDDDEAAEPISPHELPSQFLKAEYQQLVGPVLRAV
jgi:hypothetical protein